MSFTGIPSKATLDPKPFKVEFSDEALDELRTLVRLARVPAETFEQSDPERRYGLQRDWIVKAKHEWETSFDWKTHEAEINQVPQWKVDVRDEHGSTHSVHFAALFSEREDAVSIALFHGWPGSFLEFIPILRLVQQRYTPSTLPFHLIAPSLIGYTFSSGAPLDRNFDMIDCAKVMDKLLVGLGLKDYISQGGDLGAFVSRYLGVKSENCKAVHLNFCPLPRPSDFDISSLDNSERLGLERAEKWRAEGAAYAEFHATRPSTIGFVLQSSPMALLAWVGEKFLTWSDEDPEIDQILASATLWYLTDTAARSAYPYRSVHAKGQLAATKKEWYIQKPFGFSWFPKEILPTPREWIAKSGNLSFFRRHDNGGHFAAMEVPEQLWKDVEDFTNQVWGRSGADAKM